jgi:DNA polymerase III subunit alpha
MSKFVHLHTHSHYSLLEALPKVGDLLKHVNELAQDALALTDNGTLYGAIEFYQKAIDAGIKPILGVDFYVARESRHMKRARIDTRPHRLVCLASNNEGYKNLLQLSSLGFLEGFYYKPRIDKEILQKHTNGLIALSGGHLGEIDELLKLEKEKEAKEVIRWYVDLFGEENFYLELVDRPEIAQQEATNTKLIALGKELGVPVVATKNTFYLKPQDTEAWKILNCIKGGRTLEQFERQHQYDYDGSMVSGEYMEERFKDCPEAIENTRKIADRCQVELELGKWNFPKFEIEPDKTFLQVLTHKAFETLERKRQRALNQQEIDRLNYELNIIEQKGFCPYFLIVSDFLTWASDNGIVTTTRGSAAGSLVSYSVGISSIDPLLYQLPFERFLNPQRPSAPDIDADFADNRRDEVLDYVREKYGHDKVAQICTFGTMLARGSIRDVGRALGFTYGMIDEIAKLVPMGSQGFPMTLERALAEAPDLKKKYDTDQNVRRVIDLAQRIEGCARHVSIHAAGAVISPTDLTDFTPLQIDTREGKIITQYEMKSVESAGLIKMDFLGIRNLSILGDAVAMVGAVKGIEIDPVTISVDDKKTFELLAAGHTMGVFQLNGDGMTKYLMDLRPERVEDIMAMVALYRPGPIEVIPEYIRRKHDASLVKFMDPRMEEFLQKSYGLLVYQDDVMLTAIHLAGYSWLEADKLRKAMGKKIPEEMALQKVKLIDGFVEHGMPKKQATQLWKLIEPFAAYGFNKCLVGGTRVFSPLDGSYKTMEDLFEEGKKGSVFALDSSFKLRVESRDVVVQNGVKPIFELVSRSGRRICATRNHPFRVFDGWKPLEELLVGDRIAVPRTLKPGPGVGIDVRKIRALGYLIAEGNLCHPHGVYFYSKVEAEIEDFITTLEAFENVKIGVNRSKSAVSVYVGQANPRQGNQLRSWLEELELIGKRAADKQFPDLAWAMDEGELSELIAALWQGDGCISRSSGGQIYYATSSSCLAHDVQHALLRLSILSTIYTKQFSYRGGRREGFTIHISGKEHIERFTHTVGSRLLENKMSVLLQVLAERKIVYAGTGGVIARGTTDTIPAQVLETIRSEMLVAGVSANDLGVHTGLSSRLFWLDSRRKGYTRTSLQWVCEELQSEDLCALATSDVLWDEIISIAPRGDEMTYDLMVPESHNFVADDFIVHNSHAASYGMVAYQTAYMKANFPSEYMTALMTAESGDLEKISEAVKECARMGIEVLPPDINESRKDFTFISDKQIRFGLLVIKNLGEEVIESIISERKEHGLFTSLSDFAGRVSHRAFNKKSVEALIKVGALDRFGERKQLLVNLDRILLHNKNVQREKASNQQSLFAGSPAVMDQGIVLRNSEPATMRELLSWEKELLGLYVSGHPYEPFSRAFDGQLLDCAKVIEKKDKVFVRCGGIVTSVKEIITRKGDPMAFVGLEDMTGQTEVIVFPRTYTEFRHLLELDQVLLVSAKVSIRDGEEAKLIANSFIPVDESTLTATQQMLSGGQWVTASMVSSEPSTLEPETPSILHRGSLSIALKGKPTQEMVARLREILTSTPGPKPVCLMVESGGQMRRIQTDYSVAATEGVMSAIAELVGRQNVSVE